MKNNKGLVLIELLGVLVVLAMIAVIAYPIVTDTIKNIRVSTDESQGKLVISAAKLWIIDNDYLLSDNVGDVYTLYAKVLSDNGYLTAGDLKDLEKNKVIETACVKITTEEHNYSYKYEKEC